MAPAERVAVDTGRRAGKEAHLAGRHIKCIREQPHERVVCLAIACGRADPRLEHTLSIAEQLDPVNCIAAAFRRQANHNNDPARNHGPRTFGRHEVQNTFG